MCALTDLFMIEDLARLNESQLVVLRDAIMKEIRSSPEIRDILKRRLRDTLPPSMELRTQPEEPEE
jgi:hypothetical protein